MERCSGSDPGGSNGNPHCGSHISLRASSATTRAFRQSHSAPDTSSVETTHDSCTKAGNKAVISLRWQIDSSPTGQIPILIGAAALIAFAALALSYVHSVAAAIAGAVVLVALLPVALRAPELIVLLAFCSIPLGGVTLQMGDRAPNLYFAHVLAAVAWIGASARVVTRTAKPFSGQPERKQRWTKILFWTNCQYVFTLAVGLLSATDLQRSIYLFSNRLLVLTSFFVSRQYAFENQYRLRIVQLTGLVGAAIAVSFLGTAAQTYGTTNIPALAEALAQKDNLARAGFLGVTNTIASLIALTLPTTLALFTSRSSTRARWLGAVSAPLQIVALISTASRGGISSIVCGLALALLLGTGRRRGLWIGVVAVLGLLLMFWIAALLTPWALGERYALYFSFPVLAEYIGRRIELLESAWNAFAQAPVLGIGIGNFGAYDHALGTGAGSEPHNLVLGTLAEEGIIAGLCLLVTLCHVGSVLIRSARRDGDWLNLAILWAFLSTLINAMVEPTFWAPQLAFLFWPLMGVFTAGQESVPKEAHRICSLPQAVALQSTSAYAQRALWWPSCGPPPRQPIVAISELAWTPVRHSGPLAKVERSHL